MNIGIITFHGSHNYGSMLQTYATQKIIAKLGYNCEIINFRMQSQIDYYSLYQLKYGKMRIFRNILMFPIQNARKKRMNKFETFLRNRFHLSGDEMQTYKDLESVKKRYDIYLSGSDQIWSDQIPEFIASDIDYTGVYFLDFVDKQKKKIAYASSVGEIKFENLYKKKRLLKEYYSISTRETNGAEMLKKIVEKDVLTVLDPTFLLDIEEWNEIIDNKPIIDGKYIFLYTLQGIRPGQRWAKKLIKLARKLHVKVICVSPFFPIIYPGIINLINVGPEDFLNLIKNAEIVFTDSFHGTAFSINFNKPFYSFNKSGSEDTRKMGILKSLDLEERLLNSYDEIEKIINYELDYTALNQNLNNLKESSLRYLEKSIGEYY